MQNFARMSVLIVESDTAQNRALAELTSELGARDIVRVYTPEAALSWLCSRGFDVMICAEQLGTEDGVQLARDALRVSPATRSVVVRAEGATGALPLPEIERLERPLSAEKLGDFLQRARDPRGGLWCEVPELSLADILQMYHLGRRSISILLSGPVAGRIHLHGGEIAHAESGALRGLPALSRLLEASSGLLRTDTTQAELARTITLPFEHAIFEATRLLDERRRDAGRNDVPLQEAENVSTVQQSGALMPALPISRSEPSPEHIPELTSEITPEPALEVAPFAFAEPKAGNKTPMLVAASLVTILVLLGTAGIYFANRSLTPKPTQIVSSLNPRPAPGGGSSNPSSEVPGPGGGAAPAAPAEPNPDVDAGASRSPTVSPVPAEDTEQLPPTFELSIVSKPPRALVKEGSKVLGRTPLKLIIERESVAQGPRQFLLLMKGYRPYTFSQGASQTDARALAVLSPRRRPPPRATELERAKPAAGGPSNKTGMDPSPPLRH